MLCSWALGGCALAQLTCFMGGEIRSRAGVGVASGGGEGGEGLGSLSGQTGASRGRKSPSFQLQRNVN